jgi:hypothetical protein
MLFLVGYRWARVTHNNPWIVGSIMLLVGLVMVAIAMALGGWWDLHYSTISNLVRGKAWYQNKRPDNHNVRACIRVNSNLAGYPL